MKKLLYFISVVFLWSCNKASDYPGFSRLDQNLHYKLIAIGDEERPLNDTVYANFTALFRTVEDSLLAVKRFEKCKLANETSDVFRKALSQCHEGDSIFFIATAKDWDFAKLRMGLGIGDSVPVLLEIGVEKVFTEQELKDWQREQARQRDLELKEQVHLQRVLDSLGLQRGQHHGFTYVKTLKNGTGSRPTYGDYVVTDYIARFHNGREFDNTYKGSSLEFMMGKPDQILPGFATGITQMREGGKAIFVVPSLVGFGSRGSTSGIVPPFTTLIFEVELKEVRKS